MPPPPLPMPSTPKHPPPSRTDLTRHYRVSGKVQGVYFRHSARLEAKRLSLRGSVRNLPDGSVEVLAQGTPAAIEALRLWLHRGPALARVDKVAEISLGDEANSRMPVDFEIL